MKKRIVAMVLGLVVLGQGGALGQQLRTLDDEACHALYRNGNLSDLRTDGGEVPLEFVPGVVGGCVWNVLRPAMSIISVIRSGDLGRLDSVTVDGDKIPVAQFDRYLLSLHLAYKNIAKVARSLLKTDSSSSGMVITQPVRMQRFVDSADNVIHQALELRGLNRLFSAAIVSGVVVGDAGGEGSEVTRPDASTNLAAHLVFESRHFGFFKDLDGASGYDLALGGRLGFLPALSLVEMPGAQGVAGDTAVQGVFQQAFHWDLGLRANLHANSAGRAAMEISAVGRVGQTMLNQESVLVGDGVQGTLAVPVSNGTGRSEWFFETGLEYNLYDNPLEVVHAEGSTTLPLFTVGLLYRKDNRFKRSGALIDFAHPERRLVFRFMLDALTVVDKRAIAERPKSFTFGFGVEHEFGASGGKTIPSGTQLMFRGDLNVLEMLRGK